jgi:hypothetical protein
MSHRELTRRLLVIGGAASVAALACSDSESAGDDGAAGTTGGGATTSSQGGSSGSQGGGGSTGSNTGGNGTGGSMGSCGAALVVMGSNYASDPHDLMIPVADLIAGTQKTYISTGGTHTHAVTLTPADFIALASGETVTKYACRTPSNQADHEWAISCANPSVQPVLEGEFGTEANCPA